MLRRNAKIDFGGMWVFPGGRIDPEDAAADGIAPICSMSFPTPRRSTMPCEPWR